MYIIFGGLTTLVNFIVYYVLTRYILQGNIATANIAAWFVSVLFAYVTNKIFVFESKETSVYGLLKEVLLFFASRAASGLLDTVLLLFLSGVLMLNDMIAKVIIGIIIIIVNYVLSRWLIFNRKGK